VVSGSAFSNPPPADTRRLSMSRRVLFIAPWMSEATFAGTAAALDSGTREFEPLFKDMECARFTDPSQWTDWTLDAEVKAIELLRQRSMIDELDLVGYSGGAAAALAYAADHPRRLASLTLIEPPWIGNDGWSEEESAFSEAYDRLADIPSDEFWEALAGVLNGPGTPAPPPPPVEPDDLKVAFLGVWRGYRATPLDRTKLRQMTSPAYLPVGEGSARRMRAQAECLAQFLPDARIEVFGGASHFDIPLVGAEQLAAGLSRLWKASSRPS